MFEYFTSLSPKKKGLGELEELDEKLDICEKGISKELCHNVIRPVAPENGKAKQVFTITRNARREYFMRDKAGEIVLVARKIIDGYNIYGNTEVDRPSFQVRQSGENKWICVELVQTFSRNSSLVPLRQHNVIEHCIRALQKGVYYNCARLKKPSDEPLPVFPTRISAGSSDEEMEFGADQDVLMLLSKKPRWDSKSKGLTLKFSNAGVKAAHRNIQLINEGKVCCEFGMLTKDEFALEVASPMSLLDAFALSLSTEAWETESP